MGCKKQQNPSLTAAPSSSPATLASPISFSPLLSVSPTPPGLIALCIHQSSPLCRAPPSPQQCTSDPSSPLQPASPATLCGSPPPAVPASRAPLPLHEPAAEPQHPQPSSTDHHHLRRTSDLNLESLSPFSPVTPARPPVGATTQQPTHSSHRRRRSLPSPSTSPGGTPVDLRPSVPHGCSHSALQGEIFM
ncbi:vegetative cell wall protein gp1-like [Malania oleifera]|uniref:vegetative cell wall protein gp1-like n=1 Tax=Malania oleifera TaxID=397392 RepID=UPI0025AD9DE8|nr:vegetative cell wall protein gp1-like [Malania oleifera]